MFLFTQISDDEIHYLSMSIDANLIDLHVPVYDNGSGLNYEPFKCSETKEYFMTDKTEPDNNVHKLDVSRFLYYTEEHTDHYIDSKPTSPSFQVHLFTLDHRPEKDRHRKIPQNTWV